MEAHSFLIEWVISFLKNKDLIFKRIELIEGGKNGFDFFIKYKDKEQFFVVKPIIDDIKSLLSKFDESGHFGLVVANTKGNFDVLVKNWDVLAKYKNLGIYFVNPFSKLDKKWIVYPCTHNNICERGALEKGLNAMFEMVEPLTESSVKDRFK